MLWLSVLLTLSENAERTEEKERARSAKIDALRGGNMSACSSVIEGYFKKLIDVQFPKWGKDHPSNDDKDGMASLIKKNIKYQWGLLLKQGRLSMLKDSAEGSDFMEKRYGEFVKGTESLLSSHCG